ncbi:MAG: LysM peptidoglycan-binding domain-containing protein, partial [Parcubacteria group bacterium]
GNEATTFGRYTVRAGDTLRTIAMQVWGDDSLWYLLADANGLTADSELAEGMSLSIPNKVANVHNNAATFKPYDPNRAIGNILPSPIPPKPDKHHYPGLHQRIVDQELFEAVQQQLITNAKQRFERLPRAGAAMLKGLLFDQAGQRMSPSFGYGKEGRVFRYYVSADLQRGRRASADDGTVRRVSAPPLEALVVDRLSRLFGSGDPHPLSRVDLGAQFVKLTFQRGLLASVDVALADRLPPTDHLQGETLTVAVRPVFRGGRTWLIAPDGRAAITMRQPDATLVSALQRGHALLKQHHALPFQPVDAWRRVSSPEDAYRRRLMSLALPAPDIQQAIVEGAQPAGLTLQRLITLELPLAWEDQRRALGF